MAVVEIWIAPGSPMEHKDYGYAIAKQLAHHSINRCYGDSQKDVNWAPYENGEVDLVVLTGGETPVHDSGWMAGFGLHNTERLISLA